MDDHHRQLRRRRRERRCREQLIRTVDAISVGVETAWLQGAQLAEALAALCDLDGAENAAPEIRLAQSPRCPADAEEAERRIVAMVEQAAAGEPLHFESEAAE